MFKDTKKNQKINNCTFFFKILHINNILLKFNLIISNTFVEKIANDKLEFTF